MRPMFGLRYGGNSSVNADASPCRMVRDSTHDISSVKPMPKTTTPRLTFQSRPCSEGLVTALQRFAVLKVKKKNGESSLTGETSNG